MLIILICFFTQEKTYAEQVSFDISLNEFLLKNSAPLIFQIKKKSGLGFSSLKTQLSFLGCDTEILFSPTLVQKKEAYLFTRNFINVLSTCNEKRNINKKYDLKKILEDKVPYLIITGESLNSPTSYFGHSLLLFLDKEDFYFSPVISVLAPTNDLSVLEKITKGGLSFIPAEVNIIPLHQVLDFYNDQESRNLKFIRLPADSFKLEKLIDYFNSLLSKKLKYNFFTKNCSTYLYQALEYSCNCLNLKTKVITPVSIEKAIQEKFSDTSRFEISSLFDEFNHQYGVLDGKNKKIVKDMFLHGDIKNVPNDKKLGDVAVLASRLSFETYKRPNKEYEKLLNTYGKNNSLLLSQPIIEKIDSSHLDGLHTSSAKISLQKNTTHIRLSAIDFNHFEQRSYHYIDSKLSAGAIELSLTDGTTKLEVLDLINIRAITPLSFVTKKPSWKLRIGAERSENNSLEALVSISLGAAFSQSNFKYYILPSVELRSSLKFPIYSGIQMHSEFISMHYETRNFEDHTLSFFKRSHDSLGYEYTISKVEKNKFSHKVTLSYYF